MAQVRWGIPAEIYYDHTDKSNDPSFVARKTRPVGAVNVKHQILHALYSGVSGERAYVLQLAERFEGLIKDHGEYINSPTYTPYHRFLVYCCSVYYKLAFGVDFYTMNIFIHRTPTSQIPPVRISDLVSFAPELSVANLRLADHQAKSSKLTTPIPTFAAWIVDSQDQRTTIPKREAKHAAVQVGASFVTKDLGSEKILDSDDGDAPPKISNVNSTIHILGRHTAASRNKGISEDVMHTDAEDHPTEQAPTERRMTFAEREEAYRQARQRIFASFEEPSSSPPDHTKDDGSPEGSLPSADSEEVLDVDGFDPAFSRASTKLNTATVPNVRFQHHSQVSSEEKRRLPVTPKPDTSTGNTTTDRDDIAAVTDIAPPVSKVTFILPHDADLEGSETASMSGAGSVYSHASSRTKSTDYGFFYMRRALSQETLSEIMAGSFLGPISGRPVNGR